jgi:arylsulfatase
MTAKEIAMSDTQFDVVIAAYLIPDLAKKEFDGLVKLVKDKQLQVEGVALVTVDADGSVAVEETGDHLGRKGVKIGGGVGLVVGLLSPPLLAATVVGGAAGALVGKFAMHKVDLVLERSWAPRFPPGSAGIVAIYDRGKTHTVDATLTNAVKKSTAQIDGGGAKQLKAALAEAQAGFTSEPGGCPSRSGRIPHITHSLSHRTRLTVSGPISNVRTSLHRGGALFTDPTPPGEYDPATTETFWSCVLPLVRAFG